MFYTFQLHPDSYVEWEKMWLIPEIDYLALAQFHLQAWWLTYNVEIRVEFRWLQNTDGKYF